MKRTYNLQLDEGMEEKGMGWHIYRSLEKHGDQPVIGGVYIQRSVLWDLPPEQMKLSLEWDSPPVSQ